MLLICISRTSKPGRILAQESARAKKNSNNNPHEKLHFFIFSESDQDTRTLIKRTHSTQPLTHNWLGKRCLVWNTRRMWISSPCTRYGSRNG